MRLQTLVALAVVIMAASHFCNAEGNGDCKTCIDLLERKLCDPILMKLGQRNGCQTMVNHEEKQQCMADICQEQFLLKECQKSCNEYLQSCPVPIACEDTKDNCEEQLEQVLSNFWSGQEECHLDQCKKIACHADYFVQNCRKTCQPHTQICSGKCILRSDNEKWCLSATEETCPTSYVPSYYPECVPSLCEKRPDIRMRCSQTCNPGCEKRSTDDEPVTPFYGFSPSNCFDAADTSTCEEWMKDNTNNACDAECACKTNELLRDHCRKTCNPFTKVCRGRCDEDKSCERLTDYECSLRSSMEDCPKTCGDPKCITSNKGKP